MCIHIHICVYTNTYVYTHVYIYILCVCICLYLLQTVVYKHSYLYVCSYIHIYICILLSKYGDSGIKIWVGSWMAGMARLPKNSSLFCRKQSLLQGSFAIETYVFREPTNRSHLMVLSCKTGRFVTCVGLFDNKEKRPSNRRSPLHGTIYTCVCRCVFVCGCVFVCVDMCVCVCGAHNTVTPHSWTLIFGGIGCIGGFVDRRVWLSYKRGLSS